MILIPAAGTIFLLAWLALVFYAGRDHHPHGPAATRRPATQALAQPRRRPGVRQAPAQPIAARGGDTTRSGNPPTGQSRT